MDTEKKTVSEREFLESWGLFRALQLDRDWETPAKLSHDCSICKKETTWREYDSGTVSGLLVLEYHCADCEKGRVVFVVYAQREYAKRVSSGGPLPGAYTVPRVVSSVAWLVGQVPFPAAKIPRALEKRLGDDATLYKKGLTCRNEGFGIGAVSYIRRVVENKTNELIDVVADLAAAEGVPAEQVEKVKAAKESKAYDRKLEVAAPLVPISLRPGGVNPLGELHRLLSVGLHGRTEEECLQIADDLREIFEFVFERLHSQIEDLRSFKNKLTGIAGERK